MKLSDGFRLVLLACAPFWLAACAAPSPPAMLELAVIGSAGQNPNASGAPAPVAVRLYQIASPAKFGRADIFALIEHEQATLGTDLLASDEFVLAPSEQRAVQQTLKAGTQALGVAVLFQDIDRAQWRALAPVAASGTTKLRLDVGTLSVSLKPAGQ